jgi:hypothetical protein
MTKMLEILDALPGSGKTTAIFKYMANNRSSPWLYLSPMKSQIDERVPKEADEVGMTFFIATEKGKRSEYRTKTAQVLEAMQEGKNIACTHTLMLMFKSEHIQLIRDKGYNIVCDEELDLISGYNSLKKGDISFLLENKHIEVSEDDGKVSFLTEMSSEARYSDVKLYADMGCLYSAKTRNEFLVIQISPRVVEAASRFILLTYNYEGSIMSTFMKMHGFDSKLMSGISTYKTSQEIVKEVSNLLSFVETPTVKKWQRKSGLSMTWWRNISPEDTTELGKVCKSIMAACKANSESTMVTMPKGNYVGVNEEGKTVKKLVVPKLTMDVAYVTHNARATNEFAHKTLAINLCNLYPSQPVKVYMQDMGFECNNDTYALNTLIQWIFRGCIRDGKPMKVALLSGRMSTLLKEWVSKMS